MTRLTTDEPTCKITLSNRKNKPLCEYFQVSLLAETQNIKQFS